MSSSDIHCICSLFDVLGTILLSTLRVFYKPPTAESTIILHYHYHHHLSSLSLCKNPSFFFVCDPEIWPQKPTTSHIYFACVFQYHVLTFFASCRISQPPKPSRITFGKSLSRLYTKKKKNYQKAKAKVCCPSAKGSAPIRKRKSKKKYLFNTNVLRCIIVVVVVVVGPQKKYGNCFPFRRVKY